MPEATNRVIVESITLFNGRDNYAEMHLTSGDAVECHFENGESAVMAVYTLDELRQMQAAIGHLLWHADNVDVD